MHTAARFLLVATLVWGTLGLQPSLAHAQVITQLSRENLKIPRGPKPTAPQQHQHRQPVDLTVDIDTSTPYYTLLDSAQQCINAHNWEDAETYIRAALAADPDNPSGSLLLSNLATVQRYRGHNDDALRNYTMALHLTPNALTILLNRAALLAEMGRNDEAEADYERARQLDPTDAECRYSLGMMALERNDYRRAEELFTEIERVNPYSGLALEGKAMLCKSQGKMAKAVDYLGQLIRVRPDARLLGNRADCLLTLGRLNDAQADITAALLQTPDDGYLYVLRAKLAKLRFDPDAVQADIEQAERCGLPHTLVEALLNGSATSR